MNTTTHEPRGPGRPRKEDAKREHERRRKKSAETTGGRLGVNPDMIDTSRYAYRFFNDQPGRIAVKTQNDDWDLVPQDGVKEDSTDLGDMVSYVVGTHPDGSPKRAYLARKLKTFYDEDKAAEQVELDRQLELLRRGLTKDGEAQSDYVPRSGIRM